MLVKFYRKIPNRLGGFFDLHCIPFRRIRSIGIEFTIRRRSVLEFDLELWPCWTSVSYFMKNRICTFREINTNVANERTNQLTNQQTKKLVLCKYSKFSNTYRYRFLIYLTERRRFFTLATTPRNQQNLLLTMVQVLVSPWSLGPLWPTKYWNSYNRNKNSAVQ